MKKFLWISLLVMAVWAKSNCYETAQKLYNLQNSIVEKSFIALSKGAWAIYNQEIKVVSLGKKIQNNQTLYGIEVVINKKPAQIWYKMVEKSFKVAKNSISFKTLDPYEIYLSMGNGQMMHITKAQIDFFMRMQGKKWSTILTLGQINIPLQCKNIPKLKTFVYDINNKKSVKAVKITKVQTGAYIIVSNEVPFGLIKSSSLHMTDYGFAGEKVTVKASIKK